MRWASLLFFSALLLAAACAHFEQVFASDGIFFVDADCYSRMDRVRQVLDHPFRRITHHAFENFPSGTAPHTTAPLDLLIAGLARIFQPFSPDFIDLAGAWISPLLGVATLAILWIWAGRIRLRFQSAMLLLVAVSPILMQAFRLGRPDHQSLLLALLAAGLCAEHLLWDRASRRVAILWGVAWGLALWTSLYEPLVLFGAILLLRVILLRKEAFSWPRWPGLAVAAAVFGLGVLFDGWRVVPQDPEVNAFFGRWSQSIAELAHLSPFSGQFLGWLGLLAPALPILLGWRYARTRRRELILLIALLMTTYALTCWQLRWGSCFGLIGAMAMPFALAAIPVPWVAWTAFTMGLWPIAGQWDALLFPDRAARQAREEMREDYALLRETADFLRARGPGGVLAPWWLSPPLAYWSGSPCVAGSSHQSLPGIVDTARFYMTSNPEVAGEILQRRNVRYVIAYEPARVLSTSASLLGEPVPRASMAERLYDAPQRAPQPLRLVHANRYFRVFERAGFTAPDSP